MNADKSHTKKKIIIIGGGIAGLSTGVYARLSGFESEIYEMHSIPGGVCTSWKRGEYLFDHTLHWVLGCNKGTSLYPVFKDLGVADNIDFYHKEIFREVTMGDKTLKAYTDANLLEKELLRLFPHEKKGIKKYISLVRKFTHFNPPLDGTFGDFTLMQILGMLPFMIPFWRLKNTPMEDFLNKLFQDPQLKEMLYRLFPVKDLPAIMAVMPLSFMHKQEGGYPLGGSLNFAKAIEKRHKDLGGKIHYKSKVKKIIIENHTAKGIELENGKKVYADLIVSACDGRSALFDMLEGQYMTKTLNEFYSNPDLWPPIISISLGVNRNFSGYPEIIDFKLDDPITIAGNTISWGGIFHYSHDPSFAPKGKTVVSTQWETDYFYWKKLREENPKKYKKEKENMLKTFTGLLEKKFPGIEKEIEETDVATPASWERYTGNWQGSYEGWLPTTETFGKTLPLTLPGLKNFYMTGQWVFPGGGVPMVMAQGRNLLKLIVKKEGRPEKAPQAAP